LLEGAARVIEFSKNGREMVFFDGEIVAADIGSGQVLGRRGDAGNVACLGAGEDSTDLVGVSKCGTLLSLQFVDSDRKKL
jgi:hypothetical protein